MTTVLNGLLGGAVVAVFAAIAARLVGGERPAAATVGGSVSEAGRTRSGRSTLLLRVVYGSVAGGVLVALELSVLDALAVPPTVAEALTVAVPWSAALLVAVLAARRFVLSHRLDRSALATTTAYHVVYGVGLGIWIRITWIT